MSDAVAIAAPGPPPAGYRVVQFALSQVGIPYVYGGESPAGYDCSGLVQAAFGSVGITLPRVAQDQYNAGPELSSTATLLPGDVVFFGTGPTNITHDGIYIGNGQMVDAPHTGANVRVESYQWTDFVGATRPAAAFVPSAASA
jgi:cell wall-associated NlpC family hydrolase